MRFARRERDQMRRLGLTLLELLVAIGILSILGWALVLLLSSGMTTWRTGEMRRGAYERAQFIFDRIGRDLAALYPHNPPMPEEWAFQADTLFDPGYEGAADEAVSFASDNISLIEGDVRHLKPTDPGKEAWIEYRFDLPFQVKTAVVQPKITL
ncbi:MAG: prepilin-type N-terminal cleavage/methylation domain-containing protein, partial [Planctomycetota bacterium]